ncbi:MAG: SusC/RagA family TonB-linked outer membrane protein [Chitinophaga sp.]|uniref:SusC/RagA family TonB-linked outer membrane protein n=1 Tax=Chitinophaga sp. TaxID=1869181 RepID=UPI001B2B7CD4|nr:SusC/RagA family TonB-linked outer membrane protein [Chitinophaga sp.]MBO9727268.1 SusC/RagA family TonB-linked outer membrane protein [Chitinophaga sp.]
MRKLLALLCTLYLLLPLFSQGQNTYTGRITDAKGAPLPGASVMIQHSRKGTVTNADGQFSIAGPSDLVLVVNFTGYKTKTFKPGATPVTVALEEDVARLDEIVVTGLATTVKRRNAANAVAVVSAKELSGTAPAQTFDAALSGKITGANIVANSGAPGGGISVKLRGVSSVYGTTQPLYVIDGVIVSNRSISAGLNAVTSAQGGGFPTSTQDNATSRIADINPADIENVEILKGASASAIYGSQASAGVVIITTKRGKAGKTRLNISQDYGFVTASHLLGMKTLDTASVSERGWDAIRYDAAQKSGKLYNYEKEMYGNRGTTRNTSINVSGGSDKTTFLFSAGMKKEDGIIKRTGYSNNSLRLNINHRVNDRINLGLTSNYVNSSSDRGLTNNDNQSVSLGINLSYITPYDELHPDAKGIYPNPFRGANPLQTIALMTNNEKVNRVITGVNADVVLQESSSSVTKGIIRAGVDFYHQKTQALFPPILYFEIARGTGGHNVQGNSSDLNTNWSAFLVNTLTPNQSMTFTSSAGLTHEYGSFDQLINVGTNLIGGQSSESQAASVRATQTRYLFRNDGIFLQEEIAIKDYLNFTAGVRFDKSTNNGDYKKYNIYPKANASWNLTRMGNWDNSILNDLKLRVAYGESSGFPSFNSRFTTLPINNIGGLPGSLISITMGDGNIKSERQTELEGGVDVSFLNGRIGLEATFYNKIIKDLLMAARVPGSTGFSTRWINGANVRNRGIELGLRMIPVSNRSIQWTSNLNFWMNRSKVLKLDVPAFDQGNGFGTAYGTSYIEEGQSITQIKATDVNKKLVTFGDMEPKFQLSFFNEVSFLKDFSLRFLLHWKNGNSNVNLTQNTNDGGGTSYDWNDKNEKGQPIGLVRQRSPWMYVQDASYIRLREFGLYYRIRIQSVFKPVRNLQIGISANNYFTWTPYKGYDPEVSNFGTGFGSGIDLAPFPSSKRLQFHLSLDF